MIKEYKTIRQVANPLMVVDQVEGVTYNELGEIKLTNGEVTSNFQIVSTQVGDELIYTRTEKSSSRTSCTSVKLADVHTVTTGTVKVTLANGEIYEFTYGQ